jgi:hypothetical protein
MDDMITTDDDCQTSSTEQSSSDDISSVVTENLLPAYEDDPQQMCSISNIRVCSVKVHNHTSLPNLKIKHPNRSDDNEDNPFDDEKKIIIDEHVKVSHVKRSSLRSFNTEISLLRLDACSRRKSTGNVNVCRANERISQSVNQMISKQNTVRGHRTLTGVMVNQGSNRKEIASKPLITRLSISNELPFKINQNKLHVSVKHVSVKQRQSS